MKVADVAVLVIDAEARMLQRQELAIADAVLREGRSLVVAANKMDLLIDAEYSKEEYAMLSIRIILGHFSVEPPPASSSSPSATADSRRSAKDWVKGPYDRNIKLSRSR